MSTNPKTRLGAQKPNLALIPPVAMHHAAMSFEVGAKRYGPYNWRERPVDVMTYLAAAKRHIDDYLDGDDYTIEHPLTQHNLGAAIANLAIVLDAMNGHNAVDNRPPKGRSALVLEELKAAKAKEAEGE